ncbi:hypothetical protein HID58_002163, partial [Brassica napus]
TTVRSSPTIPSSASISSPSSVTLLRIKGITFFCSVFSRIPYLRSFLIAWRRTVKGMMRIGSITPEYAFDDEDSIDLACFHSTKLWMLAFLWIFKAFV